MSKWFKISAAFIGVYLLCLLILMPANIVLQWVSLPSKLQLGTVSGSIWHSQISMAKYEKLSVSNIDIKLNALSLFLLDPQFELSFGGALVSGPEGQATIDGLLTVPRVSNGIMSLRASNITPYLNLPIPVKVHDFIDIQVDEFIAGKAICQTLSGKIAWKKASVTVLEQKVNLGKLSTDLSCQQGDAILTLDEKNDLGLSFTAAIGQGFTATGDGYLTPNNNTPEAIQQVLPFLGKPDNQGRYRLRF
ncbi:MAG: type II secretion system protein N [Thalassotalea sp.]|nr:type II secretion system protein N [Thalassotalea sp.]